MNGLLAQLTNYLAHPGIAIAGAGAVAIPIVIHLLTRWHRHVQPWGAMSFLLQAYRRQRVRLLMEQYLLLALRCLTILAMAFALAGPVLSGWTRGLGLQSAERLVCLVIDDALSSQALDSTGHARFETLRREALAVIDALESGARILVLRAGRPGESVDLEAVSSPAEARQQFEHIVPRYGRSDLGQVLADLGKKIEQRAGLSDQALVVVLSDFSQLESVDSRWSALATLGRVGRVLVSRPAEPVPNTQIVSLKPRRHVVLSAWSEPTTVPVRVHLQRFGDASLTEITKLDVSAQLADVPGSIAESHREHHWVAGQTQAMVQLDVPLNPDALGRTGVRRAGAERGGWPLLVRARIGQDRLPADDVRVAAIEFRTVLDVGLIATPGANTTALAPRWWLNLALEPFDADQRWAIRSVNVEPSELDEGVVQSLDAALVLRPDLVDEHGWRTLSQLAHRGGVVWIFAPSASIRPNWGELVERQLAVDWTVGIEPQSAERSGWAQGWTLAADTIPPEPLRLLAADWSQLLQPVRVLQRLPVLLQAGAGQVWLRTDDAEQQPLLVAADLGDGHVLMLGAAIDPAWTNLPMKPLFVPLLHETLRSLLGESSRGPGPVVSGDRPVLGQRWAGARELVWKPEIVVNEPETGATQDTQSPTVQGPVVPLRLIATGLEPVEPLDIPGVYWGQPAEGNEPIVVNVDSAGGDTRTVAPEDIEQRLQAANWQWIDADDPAAGLAQSPPRTSMSWPLLWVALVLILSEMCLARYFSHAVSPTKVALWQRWILRAEKDKPGRV